MPRFQLGLLFVFDARPFNDMGVSVRTISPQRGSSVSIRSKMYSMLNGLVVLLEEGGAKGLGFLRRVASLHKSVNSAMESTRC